MTNCFSLQQFCEEHGCSLNDLRFPHGLLACSMHLDPDFQYLTYGDVGGRRARGWWEGAKATCLFFIAAFGPFATASRGLSTP